MSTSERLRKALNDKGITNGRKLAEYLDSKGVIFFARGRGGWENSHAELRFRDKAGQEQRSTFRPNGSGAVREQCVQDAMHDGFMELGVDSWSKAPFSNCWLPSEDVSRVHEEFDPEG